MRWTPPPTIYGILNVTRDSFSDGGRYLDPTSAMAQAAQLLEAGAHAIDLGAESTHPDSESVSAEEEMRRLTPVLEDLVAKGVSVAVDTWKPDVMAQTINLGADTINDVHGFRAKGALEAVKDSDVRLVIMFNRTGGFRAQKDTKPVSGPLIPRIMTFFRERIRACDAMGIDRTRIILDPGLGFFVGTAPSDSLEVLNAIPEFRALGCPIYISASRKSFIGKILDRPPAKRATGSLVAELWAAHHGASFIRTHEPAQLTDALQFFRALRPPKK